MCLAAASGSTLDDATQIGAGELGLARHDLHHERVAQPPAGAVDDYLGGARGEAEGTRDLLGAETEVGDHRNGRSVAP